MYHYAEGDVTRGPVPIEELRGRITADTLVWCEGMTDWKPASQVPELRAILEIETPLGDVNELPAEQAVVARVEPSPRTPAMMQYAVPDPSITPPGLAIASMVLGILCVPMICVWPFSILCAILAIVFGFIARAQCGREHRPGGGMAVVGILLGLVPIGIIIVFISVLVIAAVSSAAGY
jgi:hypothetical protein